MVPSKTYFYKEHKCKEIKRLKFAESFMHQKITHILSSSIYAVINAAQTIILKTSFQKNKFENRLAIRQNKRNCNKISTRATNATVQLLINSDAYFIFIFCLVSYKDIKTGYSYLESANIVPGYCIYIIHLLLKFF